MTGNHTTTDPPTASAPAARMGLRERKKLKTKLSIQREAMRLFKLQGYEETTIEQIADAAEISPSTFFNYFPTKEDVILFDEYDPVMLSLILSGPPGERFSQTIRRALEGLEGALEKDRETILERAKLSLEVPELRARYWEEMEKAQKMLGGVIAQRTGLDPMGFELRVLAIVLVAAAFEASLEWVRRGGEGKLFQLAFEALEISGVLARLDDLELQSAKR